MGVETDIDQILNSGHAVVRSANTGGVRYGNSLIIDDVSNRIDKLCWFAVANVNVPGNLIELRACTESTVGQNGVIIGNAADWAAVGRLEPPGFLMSEDFSGCLFFLFRDPFGVIYGAHCYRQSGTYANPIPYFNRFNARLLYYFDSAGRFTPLGPGIFGTVLCYVNPNKVVIRFLAVDGNTRRVVQVVDHQRIDNWRNHQIADPGIAGSLGTFTPMPLPPAQTGLKQRVAKWVLKYI